MTKPMIKPLIDIDIETQRGSLSLKLKCCMDAPWTVIFGPSGAGKTTLLRLIAKLEKPSLGHITIQAGMASFSVGMVSQQTALFPHMNVENNVAYGLAHHTRQQRRQTVIAMLDLVGASSLVDRLPGTLSGGEAQRVSLARTLAPKPSLLLLDEPLSALDATARDLLLTRLQLWLKEQKTQTILVTHDASDALATEAEVLILDQGRLQAQGPASEVLASERDRMLVRLNSHHPEKVTLPLDAAQL